jgi:hypothetical protein
MFRKHPKIKGYVLIADYPGNRKPIGHFESYTTGLFSKYPHLWKPVYYKDAIRNEKLEKLGIY